MLLRIAAIACAVAAAAQPLVLSRWRVSTWNARVARVVVVDTSPSMQQPDARARIPSALAAEIARAEQVSAYQFAQIDTEDLNDGLSRAVRILATSPPARREIVLVSDFHQGTVSSRSLGEAPPDIGLRFVRAGDLPDTREWTGPALSGWRHARWQPNVAIDSASTRVRWQSTGASPDSSPITIATAEGEQADGRAALAAAATIGRPESDGDGRTVVQFAGAAAPVGFDRAHEIRSPRNASILLSLRANPALDQAARSEEVTSAVAADAPWLAVTRDPSGRALVAAAESDERLLIWTSAHARSVFAPALIRALMLASGRQQALDSRSDSDDRRRARALVPAAGQRDRRCVVALGPKRRPLVVDGLSSRPGGRMVDSRTGPQSPARRGQCGSRLIGRPRFRRIPPRHPRRSIPATTALERLLDAVLLRARRDDRLRAAAWALAAAALTIAAARFAGVGQTAALVMGLVAGALASAADASRAGGRNRHTAAALVEAVQPALRNLIITAEELLSGTRPVAAYMRRRVLAEASSQAGP